MNGCKNCKHCKVYSYGDYFNPPDYDCIAPEVKFEGLTVDQLDDIMTRIWEDDEEWDDNETPICPAWEEAPTPEDDYWDRYAWEEKNYDKDERR